MFLKIKNIPKVLWSSDKPLNLKPKISTFFFLCLGLLLFGLGEGLLIVSFAGASPWSVLAQGIASNDPRGLTITGGLPYFGGPGNNYVTHSIAEMINKVRDSPGIKGLVTANGNYVTKQSAGIYSTEPPERAFVPKDPSIYQAEINSQKGPPVTEFANGKAIIETYTIMHDRKGPSFGILFGRLTDGSRFIANTPDDKGLLSKMISEDYLSASGKVKSVDGLNIFTPD